MGRAEMNLEANGSDRERVVTLKGEATIQQAAAFRKALAEALEGDGGDRVRVDLQRVTEVDLSCLQLLCSAHRTAAAKAKRLVLDPPGPEAFDQAVERAGLRRHVGCTHDAEGTCLWIGGRK